MRLSTGTGHPGRQAFTGPGHPQAGLAVWLGRFSRRILGAVPIQLPDRCVRLVAFQAGVIARSQLPAVGLADDHVEGLLRSGRWVTLQRGVYATFTGVPTRSALLWAALLRVWPGALSHQTAAELFGLVPGPSPLIHVTVPAQRHPARAGRIPGVIIHRSERFELACHPFLLPPRIKIDETVLDLVQASASSDEAFDWLCRAVGQRLTTSERLQTALRARAKVRWRKETLCALAEIADGVRSVLAHRYVRHVERPHGLPAARRQARIVRGTRSIYIDDLYDPYGVAVELDGQAAHPVASRFDDMRRDSANAAAGLITLRYGWADVTGRPCQVANEIAKVLRQRGWPGAPRRCGPGCSIR